jgi:hypothetical protein
MERMNNTPVTAAQFLEIFPEFCNNDLFTSSQINIWAMIAAAMVNGQRFRTLTQLAMELFIAHNIVLEALAKQAAGTPGGIPGLNRGVISTESAGALSVGYDTASALVAGAGHWNLTVYGTRLMDMVSMFGAGPIQVTGVRVCDMALSYPGSLGIECGPGWYSGGFVGQPGTGG